MHDSETVPRILAELSPVTLGESAKGGLPHDVVWSCPSGQDFTGIIKDGMPICGKLSTQHSDTLETIIFVLVCVVVWITIAFIVYRLWKSRQKCFGYPGYTATNGIIGLITGITFLVMYALYHILNALFGFEF